MKRHTPLASVASARDNLNLIYKHDGE
jgi:hypothetical protein